MNPGSVSQYIQVEVKIAEALRHVKNEPKPNLAELSRQFNIPYGRLLSRYRGEPSRSTRRPAGKKLTELQELEILEHVGQLRYHNIKRIANKILERDHIGGHFPPTVGDKWCQRFIKRYSQRFKAPDSDSGSVNTIDLAVYPTLRGPGIVPTGRMTRESSMANGLQTQTFTPPRKPVHAGRAREISDDHALRVHLEYSELDSTANFPPQILTEASLGHVNDVGVSAEHSFIDETQVLRHRPRTSTSEVAIIRPSTRYAVVVPYINNESIHQFDCNDARGLFSDPHSPSPPQALLVSENMFRFVKMYFEHSCRNMYFDNHGNLLAATGAKLDGGLCNDFDSHCFTATILAQKGLYGEFRCALSQASALVEHILRAEHPRTLACFLEVFIYFMQTGHTDVTRYFCDFIQRMSAKVSKNGRPWRQICQLLGELDLGSLEQAMAQIWKCMNDTFQSELGLLSRFAVSVRLDYIKRVVTDHVEEERLLRGLLAQLGRTPSLPTPRVMLNLAHNLNKQRCHHEAEKMALEVFALLQEYEMYASRSVERVECFKIVAHSQFNQGKPEAAEQAMREAIQMVVVQWGLHHCWVTEFKSVLEGWLRGWGREEDANSLQKEIGELLRRDEMDE